MNVRFVRNTFELLGISCLTVCFGCAAQEQCVHDLFSFNDSPSPVAIQSDCAVANSNEQWRQKSVVEPASSQDLLVQDLLPRPIVKDIATSLGALENEQRSQIRTISWTGTENVATDPTTIDTKHHQETDWLPTPASDNSRRRLSLHEVIDTALLQSPDAVIARAAGPVSGAARAVAVTYPWNPSVQVQVDPYTRDANGAFLLTKNQVSLIQTFEVRHQSRYRQRAADAGWNQQQAIIAQGELNAAAVAVKAFFDVLYRKGLRDLAQDSAAIKTRMAEIVDRRFAANLATPVERITANVAARQVQRQAELAKADYQVSLNSLQAILNLSPNEPIELEGDLDSIKWLPVSSALDQDPASSDAPSNSTAGDAGLAWVANRPDIIAAQFAVSAANANLDLAKANLIPNISTGPVYERDESGTVFWGVAAQIDLPVLNTGHPLVRQRVAELQQQLVTWKQTQARALQQAEAAVNRYRIAHQLWREQCATQDAGDKELSAVADAFEKGQASIVEVLSTQDSLIQERQIYLALLNEIAQAATDMVSALAIDPECLIE